MFRRSICFKLIKHTSTLSESRRSFMINVGQSGSARWCLILIPLSMNGSIPCPIIVSTLPLPFRFVLTLSYHIVRWDPKREDPTFFYQSAHLYIAYYNAQISIHRPFIPQSRKPNALGLPSLTICTNAARTSSRVLEAVNLRREFTPVQTVRVICPYRHNSRSEEPCSPQHSIWPSSCF
jgi:hypothetical protein